MSKRIRLALPAALFAALFCALILVPTAVTAQPLHKAPKPKMRPMGMIGGNHFQLRINGQPVANFQEAGGLQIEKEVAEYRNGGNNLNPRKVSGSSNVGDITLKRGVIAGNSQLNSWLNAVRNQRHPKRRTITIVELNETGQPVQVFKLKNATPKRWKGPNLNAKGNDRAMEELTLSAENIEIVQPPK